MCSGHISSRKVVLMITIGFIGIGGALVLALAITGIVALFHGVMSDDCQLVSDLAEDGTVTTFFGESTRVSEQLLSDPNKRRLLVKGAEVIVRHGIVVGVVSPPATMTSVNGDRTITRELATGVFAQSEPPTGA